MCYYDLYGCIGNDLESSKDICENLLGIVLQEKESFYQGGVYFSAGDKDREHFILKLNIDPIDNEPLEYEFSNYNILLYINNTSRHTYLKERLIKNNQFYLLKSTQV